MVILASASPRRKELLSIILKDFTVMPANIDENIGMVDSIEFAPEYLAKIKAEHIALSQKPDDVIIGCDTGVFIDGNMLGKPTDRANAKQMLKMLSGRKHKVITGCAIVYKGKTTTLSQTTLVEFYTLTDSEIESYLDTNEPYDKAGGYGIQGKGSLLIKGIEGDYFNVVGLPVALLNKKLNELIQRG